MRLGLKLSLFTSLGILLVLGCDSYWRVQRELRLFADQQKRDHHTLATVLSLAASAAADRAGPGRARQLLRDVNLRAGDIEIDWIADPLRSVARTTSSVVTDRASARRTLITRKPLTLGEPGQLVLRQSLYRDDQYASNTAFGAVRITALLVASSSAILFALCWWLLGVPLQLLVAGARRIGAGELETRIGLRRNDEIGELAREMNAMCAQLSTSRELAIEQTAQRSRTLERMTQVERWTTLGKLVLGLSQALGARARSIGSRASSLVETRSVLHASEKLQAVGQEANKLADALHEVGRYAASVAEAQRPEDLGHIVRHAAELVAHAAEQQRVQIELASDQAPVWLVGRAAQLQQMAINLLLNAIQAQPKGGRIRIGAHQDCRPFVREGLKIGPSAFACLIVEDEGVGMNDEVRRHMFEPMFTTREAHGATGLGLTAVSAVVEEHRGFVDVESAPGLGTRVAVFLRADEA